MAEARSYDVVVVGGGLSGLTAAYHLTRVTPDLRILVLEAKDRVGGRTLTTELKSANGKDVWDMGGQWVTDTQPHIMDLIKELQLDIYPQYHTGTKLMQLHDGILKKYYGSIPSFPILSLLEMQWFLFKFERLCKKVDVRDPLNHPKGDELSSITVDNYLSKNLHYEVTREALRVAIRTTLGFETLNMPVLFIMFYAKAAGGLMRLFESTHGSAQENRVKGGIQQISKLLMEKLGNSNVKLSSPVISIQQRHLDGGDCLVEVLTENHNKYVAKYIIMAIPIHLAADIKFEPPLPSERIKLFNNMPVGHLTKYICTYAKAFWKDKGYSGEVVSDGGPKVIEGCDTSPLSIVYDATTSNGSPALVGFIGGDQGTQWCNKPYEVRKLAILHELAKCFGDEALEPIEYAEKIWTNEPYNGGCPVGIPKTGVMQYMANHIRNPIGKVHWAGTETATVWNGYLNGAVQAGRRAAKEVLYNIRPQCLSAEDLADTAYSIPPNNKKETSTNINVFYVMASLVLSVMVFFYTIQIVE